MMAGAFPRCQTGSGGAGRGGCGLGRFAECLAHEPAQLVARVLALLEHRGVALTQEPPLGARELAAR